MASSIINSDDGVISGTAGLKSVGGDDGVLVFQSKGTETARINTDKQIVAAAGTASLPIYSTTGDLNTGIFFPAADTIAFAEGGAEAMRIDSSGNVGIGTTSVQPFKLHTSRGSMGSYPTWETTVARNIGLFETDNGEGYVVIGAPTNGYSQLSFADPASKAAGAVGYSHASDYMRFFTAATERMRITSDGTILMQQSTTNGIYLRAGASVSVATGATVAITSSNAGALVICVYEESSGNGGVFFGTYSTTVTKIAGDGSATDTGSNFAVYKSSNSHAITFKNKYADNRNFWISVFSGLAS